MRDASAEAKWQRGRRASRRTNAKRALGNDLVPRAQSKKARRILKKGEGLPLDDGMEGGH